MKAVLCPVCNGLGKYKKKSCHGCEGKGWVSVEEDTFRVYYPAEPSNPYPYTPWYTYPSTYDPYYYEDTYSASSTPGWPGYGWCSVI